jgi:hypothetical protein
MFRVNGKEVLMNIFLKFFNLQKKVTLSDAATTIYMTHSGQSVGIAASGTSNRTYSIDSSVCAAANIGAQFTFFNLGSGRLTIDMPDGVKVDDSDAGYQIYSDTDSIAIITLELVTATQFLSFSASGTWVTTTAE